MKNLKILSAILATVLILTLTLVSCGGGGGGGSGNYGKDDGKDSGTTGGGGGTMTWTAVPNSPFDKTDWIKGIAYGAGKFVAVGDIIAYSSDGITWTKVTGFKFGDYGESIQAIVWGKDKFVAVGGHGNRAYSADGVNWTRVNDSIVKSNYGFEALAYGNNMFITGGSLAGPGTGIMAYSPDGVNWTEVDSEEVILEAICYGKDKFVAGLYIPDYGSASAYTFDGLDWELITNINAFDEYYDINDIVYGGGKFVAVGAVSRAAYSSDGINWTDVKDTKFTEKGSPHTILAVAYGNNRFVAGGHGGKMAYSSDGVTWTAVGNTTFNTTEYVYSIAFGNGTFVAASKYTMAYSK